MVRTDVVAAVRQALKEPTTVAWTDAELGVILDNVLLEMAKEEPLLKRANLAIEQYTTDVEASSLSAFNIVRVEYPVGNGSYTPILRRYTPFGTTLKLDLATVPTITSGVLTGTVTFTIGSRSITGSGTLFTTELEEGDLIGKSGGTKYYQVAEVVSATALTLVESFEETGGADTIARYRDSESCARIIYGGAYTVSTTTNLPIRHDATMVLGVVGHAATEYGANYLQLKMKGITDTLSTASTATGNLSARVTQAITDLSTGRTNIGTNLAAYSSALSDVETSLDAIDTDLASARTVINTQNIGGPVAMGYANLAQTSTAEAKGRLEKAVSYLESAKTNSAYQTLAAQELAAGLTYINQTDGYIKYIGESINTNAIVRAYQGWANLKWTEYQKALGKMGRMADSVHCAGVRT